MARGIIVKKSFNSNKKADIWKILNISWLVLGFLVMLIYHLGPGKALVDGDMGGEMILSDLLNQEGAFLLTDNWYQATEIHVFFMQIIFRPLLLIWPNNWHVVRVVGTCIIYIVNTIGYLLMMKETGIKKPALWTAGALLWPMGMWRLFLGLYGGQYLVYDFFAFYILYLVLYLSRRSGVLKRFGINQFNMKQPDMQQPDLKRPDMKQSNMKQSERKPSRIKGLLAHIALAFLSFAGGINGVRETMMLFAPIDLGIVALIVVRFLKTNKSVITNWKDALKIFGREICLLLYLVYATFFNLLGYGINLTVLMKRYSFQSNTDMIWKESFSFNDILSSLSDYFSLFGYGGGDEFFSLTGLCSAAGILLAIILIFIIIRLFANRDKLSLEQEFILSSFVSGLVFCSVIFGLMEDMNEPRFWLPFMCFGIVLFEIEGDVEDLKLPNLKGVIAILLSGLIMVASAGTIKTQITNPHEGKLKNLEISMYLKEEGLTQGYAQFWLANTITEQTSGQVKTRPLMYSDTFQMMPWSNRVDYVTSYPEGEVFMVIDKKGFPGDVYEGCLYKYGNPTVIRDDDNWLVMIFDSAYDMEKAYNTALDNGEIAEK